MATEQTRPGDVPKTDAQAIIDFTRETHGTDVKIAATPRGEGAVFAAVPAGMKLESLKRFADEYRDRPERRDGAAAIEDTASFIAQVNRFKDDDSAIFVCSDRAKPSLTCVFDYHRQGPAGDPRFGKHRAVYAPKFDRSWLKWAPANPDGETQHEARDQAEFAGFLEERADDLAPPPEVDSPLGKVAAKLMTKFAGPAAMWDLAKGLHIYESAEARDQVDISTGEVKVIFTTEHKDAQGQPLNIPKLFCVAVPVFHRGPLYEMAVRLRYRRAGGRILWIIDPYRVDVIFDHAFKEIVEKVQAETGIAPIFGAPEMRG